MTSASRHSVKFPAFCDEPGLTAARASKEYNAKDGLTPGAWLYLKWLWSEPKDPPNESQWAVANHVSRNTCIKWRNDPVFQAAQYQMARDMNLRPDDLADVLKMLKRRAMEGSDKAIELYLKYADKLLPRQSERTDTVDAADLTDDELEALIAAKATSVLEDRRG